MCFFVLSFLSVQVIVNPYGTFSQKDFFTVDDKVIVNLLPSKYFKLLSDLYNSVLYLFTGKKPSQQTISDKRFNSILNELLKMTSGNSTVKGFKDKKFEPNVFYIKGLEYLSESQKARLSEILPQQDESVPQPIKFFNVETDDGAVLDTVEYSSANDNSTYMICCNPRDVNYSLYLKDDFLKKVSEGAHAKVIAFNYRGIDRSQGLIITEEDLIVDTVAQVKRLIDNDINASSITLYGFCLGGAVATLAAERLKSQGINVHLYNDRSFLTIPKFGVGFICPEKGNVLISLISSLLSILFSPVISLLTKIGGWEMDAESAWKSIDEALKKYSVVKTVEHSKLNQFDGIINTSASISSLDLPSKDTNDNCFGFDANKYKYCGHFFKPWELKSSNGLTILGSVIQCLS
ncbi:MAG: hypothetical protein EBY16_08210 [Gammaproteobacteria bacterium]|nr:hypothetical protein [Gammaproteobacteria bacterium]